MHSQPTLWRIAFDSDVATQAAFAAALEEFCIAVSSFESTPGAPWRIEGLCAARPDRAAIEARIVVVACDIGATVPALDLAPLADVDWLRRNRQSFAPLRIGRFFIHGTHWRDRVPAGAVVVALDAGIAFGSGEHASTQGCLLAIEAVLRRRPGRRRVRRARDIGCGSGILALALARALRRKVAASDSDGDSVSTTRDNARRNGVAALVRPWRSDGVARRAPIGNAARPPYDLITANILARPLCRMARELARALGTRGTLVLSGLLADQEAMVLEAYRRRRLRLRRRIALGDWRTLMVSR